MCGSTCFGRRSAHHQESTTALGAFGFTVGMWQLSVVSRGLAGYACITCQTMTNNAPTVKPEAPSAVVRS
jgi:hypothetical protein